MKVTRTKIALACGVSLFLMAPTPGDVGGCGVTAEPLSEGQYASARKTTDCKHCTQCDITTTRCANACDAGAPSDVSFPSTCKPLYQDGIVCLRALNAASCDDYTRYMSDTAPEAPTECQFCRVVAPPAGTVFEMDGGTP